jgi:hypothetical protein
MNDILVFRYKKEEKMMITDLQNDRIPINLIVIFAMNSRNRQHVAS